MVVFGHTHDAVVEDLGDGAVYINSGTWTWTRDFSGEDYAAWKRLLKYPERYTTERRLNYVRIDYTEDGLPVGRLREFRRSQERPRAASVSGWACPPDDRRHSQHPAWDGPRQSPTAPAPR